MHCIIRNYDMARSRQTLVLVAVAGLCFSTVPRSSDCQTDSTASTPAVGTRVGFDSAQRTALRDAVSELTDTIPRFRQLITVNADSVDRWTSDHRRGKASTDGYLLRSASSLTSPSPKRIRAILPQVKRVTNTSLPYSMNEGGMWAGRGSSVLLTTGIDLHLSGVRLLLAPQLAKSANTYWLLRDNARFYAPPPPPGREGGGFVFPWYVGPYSIDMPMRYGDSPLNRFTLGQSSLAVRAGKIELGAGTENEWWGPGVRNAIVLSNNAPGFPHLFFRSASPIHTRLGAIEFRWLTGALYESDYFDTVSTNNVRSLAAAAVTLRPWWAPGLTLGTAHAVYATARSFGQTQFRWFDVFRNTGHPNDVPFGDSTLTPGGADQIISLFARWVMPESGLETYLELARTEFPTNLRDFFVSPNHTQGYTLGFQWSRPVPNTSGDFRLQTEVTTLEQSATFRDRPIGSFYTSRRVIQGYTNEGQPLGAAIGPGASSQWIAGDYLGTRGSGGIYVARIRWNEDVRSVYSWPAYQEWCNHDVSLLVGARAARHTPFGFISADFSFSDRINAFFQVQSGCPTGNSQKDIHNNTLSITFLPFAR